MPQARYGRLVGNGCDAVGAGEEEIGMGALYGVRIFEEDLGRPEVVGEVVSKRFQIRRQSSVEDGHPL